MERVGALEAVDAAIVEQALGIGLGRGETRRQVREPATDHEPRKVGPTGAMARPAHSRHLLFHEILHLIDRDDHADVVLTRCTADGFADQQDRTAVARCRHDQESDRSPG